MSKLVPVPFGSPIVEAARGARRRGEVWIAIAVTATVLVAFVPAQVALFGQGDGALAWRTLIGLIALLAVCGIRAALAVRPTRREAVFSALTVVEIALAQGMLLLLSAAPAGLAGAPALTPTPELLLVLIAIRALRDHVAPVLTAGAAAFAAAAALALASDALAGAGAMPAPAIDASLANLLAILGLTAIVAWVCARARALTLAGARIQELEVAGDRAENLLAQVAAAFAEKVELEETLQKAQRTATKANLRLKSAIEAAPVGFVLFDRDDRLVLCNEEYRNTYAGIADILQPGIPFEEIIRVSVERGLQPEARGREEAWIADRIEEHRNPPGKIERELPNGRHIRIHKSRTANGDTVGFRVDLTEMKRQQRRLEELARALDASRKKAEREALHDALTQLPNRRHLDQRLAQLAETGPAHRDVHIIQIDLDRFKEINDTLGHAAGDHVLRSVADTLRASVRESDFVARLGGDEFVVLADDGADVDAAHAVAETIRAQLARPVAFEGQLCRFSASVGVATARASEAARLLVNADIALYAAKNAGRDQVVMFADSLRSGALQQSAFEDDVVRGLESDEFEPFFQPQLGAGDARLLGVEALARWRSPRRGLLTPDVFLEAATDRAVIERLDQAMLRKTVAAHGRWIEADTPSPRLALNLSVRRLLDPALFKDLDALPLNGAQLALSGSECLWFNADGERIAWAVDGLRERGIEIEIDKFGSDRASLLLLTDLQPHRVKIDRRLVGTIHRREPRRRLVQSIIDVAKAEGVVVVAEGVETAEQAELLRAMGCDALQGHFIAEAMPEAAFAAFLRADAARTALGGGEPEPEPTAAKA